MEDAMSAFDPATMRDAAMLIYSIVVLIKAIWPNGIRR
jgi:hypothetical protein